MTERQEFNRLFRSIGSYEQMDPDEVDEEEYAGLLKRYEELRNKGH